jgi:hypothetical protein
MPVSREIRRSPRPWLSLWANKHSAAAVLPGGYGYQGVEVDCLGFE